MSEIQGPTLQRKSSLEGGFEVVKKISRKGSFAVHVTSKPVVGILIAIVNVLGSITFTFGTSEGVTQGPLFGSFIGACLFPAVILLMLPILYFEFIWYRNDQGKTWYERYGDTPGFRLFWGAIYGSCIFFALISVMMRLTKSGTTTFPPASDPTRRFAEETTSNPVCFDSPDVGLLCSPDLCAATEAGNPSFTIKWCDAHPDVCAGSKSVRRTAYDFAMESCMRTCGCEGPFNPIQQSDSGITFACDMTKTCRQGKEIWNLSWSYYRHTTWLFIHVFAGLFPMIIGPLQFLKSIRANHIWVHRLFGRILVISGVINQTYATMLLIGAFIGPNLTTNRDTWVTRLGLLGMNIGTWVSLIMGVYNVMLKDIPRHGTWMIRTMGWWFSTVLFRLLLPTTVYIVGTRALAYDVVAWLSWLITWPSVEFYLAYSERFPPAATDYSKLPSN